MSIPKEKAPSARGKVRHRTSTKGRALQPQLYEESQNPSNWKKEHSGELIVVVSRSYGCEGLTVFPEAVNWADQSSMSDAYTLTAPQAPYFSIRRREGLLLYLQIRQNLKQDAHHKLGDSRKAVFPKP
jgi:hypothetical protein